MKSIYYQVTIAILLATLGLACVIGIACGIVSIINSNEEAMAEKLDVFLHKYDVFGKRLLIVEGDVKAQIKIAREFFQKYRTPEGQLYIYGKGDNSLMVEFVTDGRFRVNSLGNYVINNKK